MLLRKCHPPLRHFVAHVTRPSFEKPGASVQAQPNIELGIDVGAAPKQGEEGVFEVTLKLKARAGTQDTALFLLEMDYSGLFQLQGFGAADVEPVLLIECPSILFPFARRNIAYISAEGGIPPMLIDPVDFGALYGAQKQRAAAAAAEQAAPTPPETYQA